MNHLVKSIANFVAMALIVSLAGLTIISVFAVWELIDVRDAAYKMIFSLSILVVSYAIVIIAARHWEV